MTQLSLELLQLFAPPCMHSLASCDISQSRAGRSPDITIRVWQAHIASRKGAVRACQQMMATAKGGEVQLQQAEGKHMIVVLSCMCCILLQFLLLQSKHKAGVHTKAE